MNNIFTIEKVLDFCDYPQVILGYDRFDTQYLCVLYEDAPACRYSAVKISADRFASFYHGEIDLRTIFINPESEGDYYDVCQTNDGFEIIKYTGDTLPEERLPLEGYFHNAKDNEVLKVSVPKSERSLFFQLMHRHGWVAL